MLPFVKWAGGKRQISDIIIEQINSISKINGNNFTFYEPFVGGGAIFLKLNHKKVVINDLNMELINAYKIIKNNPIELMKLLDEHKEKYLKKEKYFYEVRVKDREDSYSELTDVEKAARTIFLNKTCYNGLYRVNLKGQFNTPDGKYVNPTMYNKENIIKLNEYFNKDIRILNHDYRTALNNVESGDIIYVDPPYDYGEDKGFTSYQKQGFTFQDFQELKTVTDSKIEKGAYVIISNNATERVIKLYENDPKYKVLFDLRHIETLRTINSNGESRKNGKEVIIVGIPLTFPHIDNLDKIILLLNSTTKCIKNEKEITRLLKLDTYNEAQYYLMTLTYLGLINSAKEFTDIANIIRKKSKKDMEIKLANLIINKNIFKDVYNIETMNNSKLTNKEIGLFLTKHYKKLDSKVLSSRAATIRQWIDWCINKLS